MKKIIFVLLSISVVLASCGKKYDSKPDEPYKPSELSEPVRFDNPALYASSDIDQDQSNKVTVTDNDSYKVEYYKKKAGLKPLPVAPALVDRFAGWVAASKKLTAQQMVAFQTDLTKALQHGGFIYIKVKGGKTCMGSLIPMYGKVVFSGDVYDQGKRLGTYGVGIAPTGKPVEPWR